jgi:alkylation response protein AidB-like acyl-CoA dehydrogenase
VTLTKLAEPSSRDKAGPVERIGRIADLIENSGADNEALGQLTAQVVDKLHEQRLFRMLLPRAYGGEELDLVTWFRAMEALGKLDASTAWCVGQINGCSAAASGLDPLVTKKIWGEPRAALSWGPPVTSRAEETAGGHRVSGEWTLSSGSRHATWIGLMAPTFDRTGAAVPLPEGAFMRVFLVPAGAVEWIDNWKVIGLNATNSGGFKVDNLFVPDGYSLYLQQPRGGDIAGPLYRFPLNSMFAIGFSGVALGIARTMLDTVIALASEKKPWLARLALRDNHLIQFQIGEAEARLRSARSNVETTAQRVWQAVVASGELTIAQRMDIRMATTFGIHEAKAVADVAWDIAGASAIFASGALERRLRDIRTITQQLQGRKTHLQEIGAYLLGLEPNLRHA